MTPTAALVWWSALEGELPPGLAAGAGPDAGAAPTGGDVAALIAYVLLALGFSFLCSLAEAALLSITPSYIAGLQKSRPRRASSRTTSTARSRRS